MEESLKRPRFLYLITACWQQWQRVSQSVSQPVSQSGFIQGVRSSKAKGRAIGSH